MSRGDGTLRAHTSAGWILSLGIAVAGALYVTLFWGSALTYLPHGPSDWAGPMRRTMSRLYAREVPLWLALQFVVGFVPAAGVMVWQRSVSSVGLGWPNVLGRRLIATSVLISIPFGFWLMATARPGQHLSREQIERYLILLTAVIPEHVLICGTLVALMLPGRRLPEAVPLAPVSGSSLLRGLRWLGLAQPRASGGGGGLLNWFGLTGESLLAIVWSGIVFWLAHLGKRDLTEVALALPGGVAVAYVTLRSRSIWPAIIAHCTMNLIPLGILCLFR